MNGATPDPSQDGGPRLFSPEQAELLSRVLDEIIPKSSDRGLPGAGEVGLASHIEQIARDTPEFGAALARGLDALVELARARGGFAALAPSDRAEILSELAAQEPGFLPGLIFQTYVAYYQAPRVVEALGLEARPPHPKGYEVELGDLTLLDEVRRRGKLYRDC
jgi:hypothetical protein